MELTPEELEAIKTLIAAARKVADHGTVELNNALATVDALNLGN